jgi:hypothetical protein
MAEPPAPESFLLAERVAATAAELEIECAVIGALALAAHNYVRATNDVDLAISVDLYPDLRMLSEKLREMGLLVELRTPDEDDPLGGMVRVWEREDEDGAALDPVEVVNFRNPYKRRVTPAAEAIRTAVRLDPNSSLRYVGLADLVALKLDAGSTRDRGDIVELLVRNPDADIEQIRAHVRRYRGLDVLEELIREAEAAHR